MSLLNKPDKMLFVSTVTQKSKATFRRLSNSHEYISIHYQYAEIQKHRNKTKQTKMMNKKKNTTIRKFIIIMLYLRYDFVLI